LNKIHKEIIVFSFLSPSGYFPLQKAETCIQTLQQWGYVVQVGKTVGLQYHYFAGTDEERLQDLQQALDNPHLQAIFCARGGYGLSRIIDQLDFTAFMQHPKWVIGFSDITILHARLQRLGFPSLHAPMANAFNDGGVEKASVKSLKTVLSGKPIHYTVAPHAFNRPGNVTAPLVGGNLTIIAHLIGSVDCVDTANKILVIEDVGEYLYNIDRMLIQLKRAGMLQNLAGLLVGGFTDMKDTTIPFGKTVEEIVREHVAEYHYPVAFHFPVSHGEPNLAVKLGVLYQLSVSENEVVLKEITESM
jgi:muramoyltetrapeptide carboxypeptidase